MVIKSSWKSEAEAEHLSTGAKKNCELSYKKNFCVNPKKSIVCNIDCGH
jgi:hypothetical protein